MPVTKTMRECYEVRNDHEWANITLHCWGRRHSVGTPHEGTYYCGEITIQSSFGTWGHIWTACGAPFKRFLVRADFYYVFTKFMGTKLKRYDGEATLAQIKRDILDQRKTHNLDRAQARDVWGWVTDEDERITSGSEESYGYAMWDIGSRLDGDHPMRDYFSDPSDWPRETKHDCQAVGFWRELWPLFVESLKAEERSSEREAG